jgi:hypothetical protein
VTVAETDSAITITYDTGHVRTFRPNGREEVLDVDGVSVGTITRREASRLTVSYNIEEGRSLHYAYEHAENPSRLVVEIELVGRGGGDKVRLVYEPGIATPAATQGAPVVAATFNQQPGVELKGLTSLGLVVEDLSAEAAACGLTQSTLEAAVSKGLTDAGFRVRRNADEDTYVYVHVITTHPSSSLCVSRYDVFFYTHVVATLSYQQTPVLVQVSLLNKGGLAGGSPATHPAAVLRGVRDFLDQLSGQIRSANK